MLQCGGSGGSSSEWGIRGRVKPPRARSPFTLFYGSHVISTFAPLARNGCSFFRSVLCLSCARCFDFHSHSVAFRYSLLFVVSFTSPSRDKPFLTSAFAPSPALMIVSSCGSAIILIVNDHSIVWFSFGFTSRFSTTNEANQNATAGHVFCIFVGRLGGPIF